MPRPLSTCAAADGGRRMSRPTQFEGLFAAPAQREARAGIERLLGQNNNRSLRPNVQLANDAAEVIILKAKKSGEIGAARNARVQPLGDQLRPDLRCLCCRSEPSGELCGRLLRG